MVGARHATRCQQHYEEEGGHGKADDDGRERECLGHGVGIVGQVLRHPGLQHGLLVNRQAQAAHAEDERVDGVRQQRQAHDDREGAGPQQQPYARAGEHANGQGQYQFHAVSPRVVGTVAAAACSAASSSARALLYRWLRTDWWAMPVRMSMVEPTTRVNTPMSKNSALATWISPTTGSAKCAVWLVRKGWPRAQPPRPVANAASRPTPIQRRGYSGRWASTQDVPETMYCGSRATENTSPATNPPPGSLWPRMKR